jgi:hypothetical protein
MALAAFGCDATSWSRREPGVERRLLSSIESKCVADLRRCARSPHLAGAAAASRGSFGLLWNVAYAPPTR